MIKILILILIIIFLVINYRRTELYSNRYQDTDSLSKFKIFGTNITKDKPLLTLYFDRSEPNCRYFYDYFSLNFGGLENSNSNSPSVSNSLRFQNEIQFSGESQPWNQLKSLYSITSPAENKHHFINTDFLTIEEIEVDQYNISNFNSLPAYRIDGQGQIETLANSKREYNQYYRDSNFVPRIPFVTLTFLKHKTGDDLQNSINQLNSPSPSLLRTFDKYDLHTIIYDGLYSPNNRAIRTTLDNLKNFIEETYEKYLKVANLATYQILTSQTNTSFTAINYGGKTINKINNNSEYFI